MYYNVQTCPALWYQLAKEYPNLCALYGAHLCNKVINYTFRQMNEIAQKSSQVFHGLGVTKGGARAIQGAETPTEELHYIYEHSDLKKHDGGTCSLMTSLVVFPRRSKRAMHICKPGIILYSTYTLLHEV
eukprot:3649786-Ditylum_brightwellii.AAC.1